MSGVLGLADPRKRQPVQPALDAMIGALRHREWHAADAFADDRLGVGIARTSIGIFNRERQPVESEGGCVAVMAGVLFEPDVCRRELERRGHVLASGADVELLLRLYVEHGWDFCSHVKGEFVVALWDPVQAELIVANDRFGFYPTYYATVNDCLLFAPEMKPIVRSPAGAARLDETARAQYLRFQCLLGARTFFEGVRVLPPGSVLRFRLPTASLTVEPYWRLTSIPRAPAMPLAEAVEETGRLLTIALNRIPPRGRRLGLYLTGGLDSRLLLGLLRGAGHTVTTFTFGQRRCRDVVHARRLARLAGADHHWFALDDGAWVTEWAPFHLQITEGLHSWIHSHGISTLPEARQRMDVAMTGWDGGTVVGGWLNKLPLAGEDDDIDVIAARQFQRLTQRYTWPGLTEGEARALLTSTHAGLGDRVFESLREELVPFMDCPPDTREELFYVRNHCFRLTLNFLTMLRSHVEVVSPFFDFDLFTFVYSLPPSLRGYKLLERAVLQRYAPSLCYVPDARTEMLPTTHDPIRTVHSWVRKLGRPLRARIAGIRPLHPLYADYESYLRTDLRSWGEEILLGRRTLERGIFNPTLLRALWQRMQGGDEPDMIGKIAPIMTYELMLRSLVDQ